MPAETFSHTITVAAAPAKIAAALEQPDTWKGLGPIDAVWDAVHDDGRLVRFSWSARAAGKTWHGTAERSGEPGTMALELDSSEIAGTITVALEPSIEGTSLTVSLTARSKSLLAGMFWGTVAGALRSGLPGQVSEFAEQF